MKKLLILTLALILSLSMAACAPDAILNPGAATTDVATTEAATTEATSREEVTVDETADAVTTEEVTTEEATTVPETTEAALETILSEEKIEELVQSEKFKNVTMNMVGAIDGNQDFDCTIYFEDDKCSVFEYGHHQLYLDEEADMVRSIFVDTAIAVLSHGDNFVLTENGYFCGDTITYDCYIIDIGPATIVSTNNLVNLDAKGNLLTLSCSMLQTCGDDVVNVTNVTFTFTDYGTTVVDMGAFTTEEVTHYVDTDMYVSGKTE